MTEHTYDSLFNTKQKNMESFTLNLKNYSKKLIEALSRTFDQAKQFRYEFITPEMLLYNIVTQPEFI